MSKKDILEWFYTNSMTLNGTKMLILLLVGLLMGAVIFMTYQFTYQGVSYSYKFNVSNVVILLITVVIMMMISSNIVISLGMVGALSIVRFRTAIKDSRDTVYIFWSIVEGLCIGSQNIKLAVISTLVIALVLILFSVIPYKKDMYLLIIRGGIQTIGEDAIEACIKPYVSKFQLKNAHRTKHSTELIYEVRAKGHLNMKIIEALQSIEGVDSVNWLLQSGESVG